jgi:hypothetical protein
LDKNIEGMDVGIEKLGVEFWRNGWSNEGGLEKIQ